MTTGTVADYAKIGAFSALDLDLRFPVGRSVLAPGLLASAGWFRAVGIGVADILVIPVGPDFHWTFAADANPGVSLHAAAGPAAVVAITSWADTVWKISPFVAGGIIVDFRLGAGPRAAPRGGVHGGLRGLDGAPGVHAAARAADPVLKGSVVTMARRLLVKVLALLLSTALLVSCNPFGLRDLLEAATRSALSIDPTDVTMPAGATLTFSADGGVPPYTYTTTNGSIDPGTGEYIAPLSAGSATITVTDFAGATADTGVTITELVTGLSLSPSSITVSVNTSLTFEGIGGTGPYTYSFQSMGSGSPDINPATGYYVAGSIGATTDVVLVTDALAATATATVTVVALASAVDYSVTSTAGLPASGVAGAAITGGLTFRVQNAGPGDGAVPVDWTVYLSANAVLDGGDIVVDEGTTPALDDDEWVDVALSGTYPTGPTGAGFLIVTVDSADDTSPGNNTSTPKAFTLDPRPVDYYVPTVNHTGGSTTGQAVNGNFTVENQLAAAGSSNFSWYVYASIDTVIDVGDYLLQRGSHVPLPGASSDVISLTSAFWPTTPAMYRLLVRVSAADDIVGTNDTGWTSQVDVHGGASCRRRLPGRRSGVPRRHRQPAMT